MVTGEDHDWAIIEDDIAQLRSMYFIAEARKHFIPAPEFNSKKGTWERSDVTDYYRLSAAAIRELRAAIRAERKENSELARSWLPAIAAIISALIAVLAVILGRR
jgi:hypothetical protein